MANKGPKIMDDKYDINPPVNAMLSIVDDFLEGAPFTESLCERVASTYSLEETTLSYKKTMQFVKSVMGQSRRTSAGKDVVVFHVGYSFSDLEKALLIRLINLSCHGKSIIVVNGEIVFIPQGFRKYKGDEIRLYVHHAIESAKPSWVHRFLSIFTRSLPSDSPLFQPV